MKRFTHLMLIPLLLLTATLHAGYTDVRTALSPTATWRCDDSSGDLTDSVSTNDLQANGASQSYSQTGLVPGLVGTSNSVTTIINSAWTRSTAPSGINASGTYTIEAWIKPTAFIDATNGFIYCRLHSGGDFAILAVEGVGTTTGKLKAMWEVSSTNVSAESDAAVLSTGTVYHVVAVYNETAVTLYVDGIAVAATAGTEDPALAGADRIGVGMSPYSTFDFATGIDELSLYNHALTSMDVKDLYLERTQIADTDAGVYNAAAIETIWSNMRKRRTDIAFIGDSNTKLGDNKGHDDGHQQAYHDLVAPPYGIGVLPFDPAGDWGYESQGVEPVGPTDTPDALPSWLEDLTMTGPTNTVIRDSHFYIADGSDTANIRDELNFTLANEDIHNPDEHLTYHITAANFATGSGTDNFRFSIRTDSNFSSDTSDWYQTVTGTDELVDYSYDIPSAARGESTAVRIGVMPVLTGSTASDNITGPFYAAYQQVEYPDRQPGPRFSVMMAAPGNDTYDCALGLNQSETEAIAEQLRQFVRLQPERKMLIVQITHAINDIVNANDNAAWDPVDEDFTSSYMSNEPDGFANNTRYVMDRITEAWAYLDANETDHYMTGDLRFIVGATHPKDDGTITINGVGRTHVQWLDLFYDVLRSRLWSDVTIIKGNELVTTATMTSNSEYDGGGTAHLTVTGYNNHAAREVAALINELGTPLADVTTDAIAAAVWEKLTSTLTTTDSVGKLMADNIDATVSSRSTFDDTADTVDVGKVDGSTVAADALQKVFDGTGAPIKIAATQVGGAALTIENTLTGGHGVLIDHGGSSGFGMTILADGSGGTAVGLTDDSDVGVGGSSDLTGLADAAALGVLTTPANTLATDASGYVDLSDVDGVTNDKLREMQLSSITGLTSLTDNGDGTKTLRFYKQDGTTPLIDITFNTSGEWTATEIDPSP